MRHLEDSTPQRCKNLPPASKETYNTVTLADAVPVRFVTSKLTKGKGEESSAGYTVSTHKYRYAHTGVGKPNLLLTNKLSSKQAISTQASDLGITVIVDESASPAFNRSQIKKPKQNKQRTTRRNH